MPIRIELFASYALELPVRCEANVAPFYGGPGLTKLAPNFRVRCQLISQEPKPTVETVCSHQIAGMVTGDECEQDHVDTQPIR
jgi:hypothetical protein